MADSKRSDQAIHLLAWEVREHFPGITDASAGPRDYINTSKTVGTLSALVLLRALRKEGFPIPDVYSPEMEGLIARIDEEAMAISFLDEREVVKTIHAREAPRQA